MGNTRTRSSLRRWSLGSRGVELLAVVGIGVLAFSFVPLAAEAVNGAGGDGGITNPLGAGCATIDQCLKNVVDAALGLAGILALAGIVWGGFLYITAGGNQDRIEQGKNAVFYSVVGLIVIGLAFAIVTFIFQALGGGGGTGIQPGSETGINPGGGAGINP